MSGMAGADVRVPDDLIEDIHYHFHLMANATTPLAAAAHLIELSNRVFDLSTYHPTFDGRTATLSWQWDDDIHVPSGDA